MSLPTQDEATAAQAGLSAAGILPPCPGLILVLSAGSPALFALPVGPQGVVLGREDVGGLPAEDHRMSRRHTRVARSGGAWVVEDLQSRNGTFVDGERIEGAVTLAAPRILRLGGSILAFVADVSPYRNQAVLLDDGVVRGPILRRALADIARAGASSDVLLVRGESGAGKELAAHTFHKGGPHAKGPFVPVNCAAIPETMAERLLFGARKGSYSGATADAQGFIAAAEGGVLFLDEVGELSLDTQAKLLRFLETREIVPLGATRPQRVDVRVVCATHRDLRKSIAAERFRADLYYRLAQLTVTLPALRDRLEEVPWLVAEALARFGAPGRSTPGLVEACMARPWPGNVRELLGALRTAVHSAHDAPAVTAAHLPEGAGLPLPSEASSEVVPASSVAVPAAAPQSPPPSGDDERANILAALDRCGGNQALAAAQLGLSRRTFIRRLETLQVPRPRLTARALKGNNGA